MRKKLIKKIFPAIVASVVTIAITGSTLLSTSASNLLPGVEKVISNVEKSDTKTYRILEIVPKTGLGEIGYYVKDGEYNYISLLMQQYMSTDPNTGAAQTNTSFASRKGLFSSIISTLSLMSVCTIDSAKSSEYPIYCSNADGWNEKYFISSDGTDNSYHLLNFPEGITENVPMNGTFIANTAGTGNYNLNVTAGAEIPSGAASADPEYFVQNVLNGFYYVTFQLGSDDALTQYGAYTMADGVYTKADVMTESTEYYYVSSVQTATEVSAAGTSTTETNPNIVRCDAAYFVYTPDEKGAYDFTPGSESDKEYTITVNHVYYTCPITNNEWFLKKIFGIQNSNDNFKIQVDTKTPSEIESMQDFDLGVYDFTYLCGNNLASYTGLTDPYHSATYVTTNDISFAKLLYLIRMATDETIYMPFVVDSSILNDSSQDTYISRLAALLLQEDTGNVYTQDFLGLTDDSTITWTNYFSSVIGADKNQFNYVNKNVYCFRDLSSNEGNTNADLNRRLVSNDFSTEFTGSESLSKGFFVISELIANENTIRSGSDIISTAISQATAVQYIINYLGRRQITKKTQLKVLEIEPCPCTTATCDLTATDVKNFSLEYQDLDDSQIKITPMSTSEFIGKIDDLNTTYDIIYIGTNVGKMNTDSKGNTVYNDTSMAGIVYSHTGDQVVCSPKLGGLLVTDYVNNNKDSYLKGSTDYQETYRYSGNDITKANLKQLEDFIGAKYAVVVDSRLYKDTNGQLSVNSSIVDNSSNLYQFLDDEKMADNIALANVTRTSAGLAKRDTKTKIAVNLIQQPTFFYYMNMPKLSLTVTENKEVTVNSATTLSWDVTIASEVETDINTNYNLSLYFDLNADGRFSTQEKMTDAIIKQNGVTLSPGTDGQYHLSTGQYEISRMIIGDFMGELPWKIEATQASPKNEYIRSSSTGYKELKIGTKPTIKILQIMQDSNVGGGYSNNWDMQNDTNFKSMLKDVNDYNINITSIASDSYVKMFNQQASLNPASNILDNYDMLILGFADVYKDIDNTIDADNKLKIGPVTAIENFIADGKSVLFTHDTTSFVNVSKSANYKTSNGDAMAAYWGYNINTIMRNIVGMDRYGITGVNSDGSLNATAKLLRQGGALALTLGNDNKTVYAGNTKLTGNDFAYRINSNKKITYAQTQGYTNGMLNSGKLATSTYYSLSNTKAPGISAGGNGAYDDMYVAQENSGLITHYPNLISTEISVAPTHYQYYQLDLEADDDHDGQSDIVVWYTIDKDGSVSATPYSASPHDVRNNYYIYSKGNVMYSGVGHSKVNTDEDKGSVEEAKLFINCIVAAYKNGVQNPAVTILSNGSIDSAVKTSEYLTFDAAMADDTSGASKGDLDSAVKLYYSVFDSNLSTSTKDIRVNYYIKDDTNGSDSIIKGVKLRKLTGLTTYKGTTALSNDANGNATGLASGNVYNTTLADPYGLVGSDNTAEIYVVVSNSFKYYGKTYTNLMGYSKLTLLKTQLFDMD